MVEQEHLTSRASAARREDVARVQVTVREGEARRRRDARLHHAWLRLEHPANDVAIRLREALGHRCEHHGKPGACFGEAALDVVRRFRRLRPAVGMQAPDGVHQRPAVVFGDDDVIEVAMRRREVVEEQVVVRRVGRRVMASNERRIFQPGEERLVIVDLAGAKVDAEPIFTRSFITSPLMVSLTTSLTCAPQLLTSSTLLISVTRR